MFAQQKRDYYSVNADIAIEASQQQRQIESEDLANKIRKESNLSFYQDDMVQSRLGMSDGDEQFEV